jgi:hypothetical protein
MSDTYQPTSGTEQAKEPRTIRVKLGTGREWSAPVEVITAMLASMSVDNPSFVGRHLQAALMGEMPPAGRQRRTGQAGE